MSTLSLHAEPLRDEWLDAYGHLNEAYYLVPFSNATWKLQDYFGIGVDYFERTACALYTVETHLRYLHEVRQRSGETAPPLLQIESEILGSDAKRIWFAHRMLVADTLCATGEFMVLHYDTDAGATAALPTAVQDQLAADCVVEPPEWAGRRIRLLPSRRP